MNLAAASGENLGTTSDIVTDALTAFGLKASDSPGQCGLFPHSSILSTGLMSMFVS